MANYLLIQFFCTLLFFISSPIAAGSSFRPRALVLPVSKDASTNQYLTVINQRTPLVPVKLTLDLGGKSQWVDCDQNYVSSSYKPVPCHSAQCSLASRSRGCFVKCIGSQKPGCNNNSCASFLSNTVTHRDIFAEVDQDVISIQSTDGLNPGRVVSVPKFIFNCGITDVLQDLASGVTGMAGLGRSKISLPSQFSSAFSFDRKFAICLTSTESGKNGVVFFGDGPYVLLPKIDVSESLTYTPLILNPVSSVSTFEGDPSADYFIGVKYCNADDDSQCFYQ